MVGIRLRSECRGVGGSLALAVAVGEYLDEGVLHAELKVWRQPPARQDWSIQDST